MPSDDQDNVQNRLLRALPPSDFLLLQPHLSRVAAPLHLRVIASNSPIAHFFFPESGFVSITTQATEIKVEVGLIGHEGVVGAAPLLLGSDRSPHAHFVQAAGEGLFIQRDDVEAACAASPSLHRHLLRFVHVLHIQTAETAFANATYTIEVRLCRWLLMCQDRLRTDELTLTHEFLSMMLGVQRTSVTLALQALEGDGLIRSRRGRIEVRSRERMRAAAGDGYGVPEAEYTRLFEAADAAPTRDAARHPGEP